MTPTMPMTTDNIYKFATLLGVALLASVILLCLYLPEKYGEITFNDHVELQLLKSKVNPSKEETIKIDALEEKYRAIVNNFWSLLWGGAILAILGIFLFLWGGISWLRIVQPKQNELLNLQIVKTKLEIMELEKKLQEKE